MKNDDVPMYVYSTLDSSNTGSDGHDHDDLVRAASAKRGPTTGDDDNEGKTTRQFELHSVGLAPRVGQLAGVILGIELHGRW